MKKLYRSLNDKKIFGVCGGWAEYFNIDSTLMRIGWIMLSLITGFFPVFITYLVAAIITPKNNNHQSPAL
ncbi:MAG: hypothetical protein COU29_01165 [Candidatus Magasanikbacteria bacterium CG10_big_fil_rev_8_21_14_0_10_36_32]|uniref:Phage shock protein PspC N-terminal domain-containing protein n=1 Tax=Candidatus Magasanikbacteria bacterium CG10_big_fil_rev_8_21_14_0_10_36_32 TaxID=1974646 RepID=A0A2M6W6F5_9BACT|nr:MAG: hypothetical protein COU29_01165 [Candidatus Magasanikbacteria bacterium CG10_big_fil_rev_8_21_14_0_10_36_32]